MRAVDASKALALQGVRDVIHRFNAPKAAFRGEETIFREEVRFVGDEVAAVAADSADAAEAALALIAVDYEVLPARRGFAEARRHTRGIQRRRGDHRSDVSDLYADPQLA